MCRDVVVSAFEDARLGRLGLGQGAAVEPTDERSVDEFAEAIAKAIEATGSFASVSRTGEPGPGVVLVDGRVTRFDPGRAVERAIGFGAGSPTLVATLSFRAGSDTKAIGSYDARDSAGQSPGLPGAVAVGAALGSLGAVAVAAPFLAAISVLQNLDWLIENHAVAVAEKLHLACFDEYPADAQQRRDPEGSARARGRNRYRFPR